MTVFVTDGADKAYIDWEPGSSLKNVFRGNKDATLSGGFERFTKGWEGDVNAEWDVGHYVLSGTFEIEDKGVTHLVKPGDFVNIGKGSQITFRALEDVEAVFFCTPKYED